MSTSSANYLPNRARLNDTMLPNIVFLKCNTINKDLGRRPLTSDVKSWDTVSSYDSLETVLSLSWSWSRGLHCFGLDLGLEYTILVSYPVDTFIETVGHNAYCTCASFPKVAIVKSYSCWTVGQRCSTRNQDSDSSPTRVQVLVSSTTSLPNSIFTNLFLV